MVFCFYKDSNIRSPINPSLPFTTLPLNCSHLTQFLTTIALFKHTNTNTIFFPQDSDRLLYGYLRKALDPYLEILASHLHGKNVFKLIKDAPPM